MKIGRLQLEKPEGLIWHDQFQGNECIMSSQPQPHLHSAIPCQTYTPVLCLCLALTEHSTSISMREVHACTTQRPNTVGRLCHCQNLVTTMITSTHYVYIYFNHYVYVYSTHYTYVYHPVKVVGNSKLLQGKVCR